MPIHTVIPGSLFSCRDFGFDLTFNTVGKFPITRTVEEIHFQGHFKVTGSMQVYLIFHSTPDTVGIFPIKAVLIRIIFHSNLRPGLS